MKSTLASSVIKIAVSNPKYQRILAKLQPGSQILVMKAGLTAKVALFFEVNEQNVHN